MTAAGSTKNQASIAAVSAKSEADAETLSNQLTIGLDQVGFIVLKAREFDVKDVVTDPDSGSNAADDNMSSVLEDHDDDPVQHEIKSYIDAMNVDEQIDLVALAWLGRGDFSVDDWPSVRQEAEAARNAHTAGYLLGMPHLPDHLENGLALFGLDCRSTEAEHL